MEYDLINSYVNGAFLMNLKIVTDTRSKDMNEKVFLFNKGRQYITLQWMKL